MSCKPRVALCARVSTSDKNQEPETQFLPLREFAAAQRRADLIVVWKLDRVFRSAAHMAATVEQLRRWGVARDPTPNRG